MLFSERIAARITETGALVSAYVIMGAAFLGYALVRDPVLLVALCAVKGLGYGVWLTATVRAVTRRTVEQWASTAQAMLTMCLMGLAPLVAGPLGGLLLDSVSPGAVFVAAAISLGAAAVVVLPIGRYGRPSRTPASAVS